MFKAIKYKKKKKKMLLLLAIPCDIVIYYVGIIIRIVKRYVGSVRRRNRDGVRWKGKN